MRTALLAAAVATITFTAGPAFSAEPIVGTWKRPSTGTVVKFSDGGGKYCGTVQNGKFKGQSIGCFSGKGGTYNGSITDLEAKKTYTGKASMQGSGLSLKGCVAGVLCRGETWQRM